MTVDEIITLVNIALGNAQPSACAHGVPSGADVDVTMIIQAVNNALNGCAAGVRNVRLRVRRFQPARGVRRPRPTNGQSSLGAKRLPTASCTGAKGHTPMKVRSPILSSSVARGIAILYTAVSITSAYTARADIHNQDGRHHGDTDADEYGDGGDSTHTNTDAHGDRNAADTDTTRPALENVWTSHGPGVLYVYALAIDPITPGTLYAATMPAAADTVFKSTDGGGTWSAANTGLTVPSRRRRSGHRSDHPEHALRGDRRSGRVQEHGRRRQLAGGQLRHADRYVVSPAFAIDPTTPSTLYAGTVERRRVQEHGRRRQLAGGQHGPAERPYVPALAIDPITPSTLYAGDVRGGVFKSTDGGGAGAAADTGLHRHLRHRPRHRSQHRPSTLYAGTDGGVFKSTDGGEHLEGCSTPVCPQHLASPRLPSIPSPPARSTPGRTTGVFSIQQVPAAGVVGTGTAASCTDAALNAALAGGGLVTFDCGPAPVTIDISTGTGTKTIAADTTIDGGGLITISGGNSVGVFCVNAGVKFTVQNLTIANGNGTGGGGGIDNDGGTLTVTNSTFSGNSARRRRHRRRHRQRRHADGHQQHLLRQ